VGRAPGSVGDPNADLAELRIGAKAEQIATVDLPWL